MDAHDEDFDAKIRRERDEYQARMRDQQQANREAAEAEARAAAESAGRDRAAWAKIDKLYGLLRDRGFPGRQDMIYIVTHTPRWWQSGFPERVQQVFGQGWKLCDWTSTFQVSEQIYDEGLVDSTRYVDGIFLRDTGEVYMEAYVHEHSPFKLVEHGSEVGGLANVDSGITQIVSEHNLDW